MAGNSIAKMARNCTICYLIIHVFTFSQIAILMGLYTNAQDPCTSYLTLADITMTTDYVQGPQYPLRDGDVIDNFKWYRYTGTTQGVFASTAPQGTQCLSLNQIWSSYPIPVVGCNAFIHFCVKDNSKPCAQRGQMQAKNCGTFVVYQLNKPPGSRARFCFEGNSTMSPKPTQTPCGSTPSSLTSSSFESTLSSKTFSTSISAGYTPSTSSLTVTSILPSTSKKGLTSLSSVYSTTSSTRTIHTSPLMSMSTKPITTSTTVKSAKTTSLSVRPTTSTKNHSATRTSKHPINKPNTTITTSLVPDKSTVNIQSSKERSEANDKTAGLIAGIVVCSIVLVSSLIVIVWKMYGRQKYTVSKSRNFNHDSMRNAKPRFDLHSRATN